MSRSKRMVVLLVLVALLLSACQPIQPAAPVMMDAQPIAPEVFVQGVQLHAPDGLTFGPDGNLYVANWHGRDIVVMNPDSGEIVDRIGNDVGVDTSAGVAFGPDDTLYWTSFWDGGVCGLTSGGKKTCQDFDGFSLSVTVSDGGRLFASAGPLADILYELDPALVDPPRLIANIPGVIAHFDFGPDGWLYAPIQYAGEIVRVNVDSEPVIVETVAAGIPWVWAVRFDSQGQLHAVAGMDPLHDRIIRVDTDTGASEMVAQMPSGLGELVFNGDDRLFAAQTYNGAIYEVLANGEVRTASPGGVTAAGDVAVLPRLDGESVFLGDSFWLREFDAATGEERSVARVTSFPGSVVEAQTVAADGENLILTSFWRNAVQVWNPWTQEELERYDDFNMPANAIRFQGDLVVAELGTSSVVRASAADPSQRVTIATNLDTPAGLAASDGDLWVSDYGKGSILQLVANGEALAEPRLVATDLAGPEGLTLTPDGRLLVVETGAGRLSAIDLETGETSIVSTGLGTTANNPEGATPTWVFSGVAVSPSGAIYVTGDAANVIYRIPSAPTASASPSTLDDATVGEIESIVETAMQNSRVPGMAVGVVKDGELVYAQGFGVSNADTGEPVTADTAFLWAENTFPVTAVAIMQLVDQGLIDLDAPITDYLPYFELADERYVDMTVRHILQHRSGLGESGDYMANWTTFQPEYDEGALERYVRGMADKSLLFRPGERQEWSDVSFAILGDVIAKVSGQSFEEYMQEHILSPLGMAHSSFLPDDFDAKSLARPHVMEASELVVAEHFPYHRPFGAINNLMASAADMARFAQAMVQRGHIEGGSIVSENAFDQMWSDSEPTAFGHFPFGVEYPTKVMMEWGTGWFVSEDAGTPTYASFGQDYGFHGQMIVAPEEGLAVVAVGNMAVTGAFYASDVAADILGLLLTQKEEAQTSPEVSDLDPALAAEIETMVEEMMAENAIPGYALGIVEDGEIVYTKGFGVERVGSDEPVTPHTVFAPARAGKTPTAMAVMQLVDQGKLDLDAPVTDYLPYFKLADERYKDITVGQLLMHTSGIPDSGDRMADWENFMPEYDSGATERWVRNDLAETGTALCAGIGLRIQRPGLCAPRRGCRRSQRSNLRGVYE